MATFVNLNCFLNAQGNNGQTGGTWKYGNLTTGLPTGWTNGQTIPAQNTTQFDITNYAKGKSFPFVYTIGSGSCISTTTYILQTAEDLTISGPTTLPICSVNNILSGNSVNLAVNSPAAYTWSATSSNATISPNSGSGTLGSSTLNFTVNGTAGTTGTIAVTIVPASASNNFATGCITNNPPTANPCGETYNISFTIAANISAGTPLTSTVCSTSLTYQSFDTFFGGTKIVPTGYTETYYINNVLVNLPYIFNTTPSQQTLKRRITNGVCTNETSSTINISTGTSSGISNSETVCNN